MTTGHSVRWKWSCAIKFIGLQLIKPVTSVTGFVLVKNTPNHPVGSGVAESNAPAIPAANAAYPTLRYVGVGICWGGYRAGCKVGCLQRVFLW